MCSFVSLGSYHVPVSNALRVERARVGFWICLGVALARKIQKKQHEDPRVQVQVEAEPAVKTEPVMIDLDIYLTTGETIQVQAS